MPVNIHNAIIKPFDVKERFNHFMAGIPVNPQMPLMRWYWDPSGTNKDTAYLGDDESKGRYNEEVIDGFRCFSPYNFYKDEYKQLVLTNRAYDQTWFNGMLSDQLYRYGSILFTIQFGHKVSATTDEWVGFADPTHDGGAVGIYVESAGTYPKLRNRDGMGNVRDVELSDDGHVGANDWYDTPVRVWIHWTPFGTFVYSVDTAGNFVELARNPYYIPDLPLDVGFVNNELYVATEYKMILKNIEWYPFVDSMSLEKFLTKYGSLNPLHGNVTNGTTILKTVSANKKYYITSVALNIYNINNGSAAYCRGYIQANGKTIAELEGGFSNFAGVLGDGRAFSHNFNPPLEILETETITLVSSNGDTKTTGSVTGYDI